MKNGTMKKNNGFTLIELLVVIAIIALLLSILMPALSKVKEQAKILVCCSNLSQTGKAAYAYATDFDGYLPPHGGMINGNFEMLSAIGSGVEGNGNGTAFGLLVSEPYGWSTTGYLPNAEVLICPSDKPENHEVKSREKGYFFHYSPGDQMSYVHVYIVAPDLSWAPVPSRYRLEKSPGKAVHLIERGYWYDDSVYFNYHYGPAFHAAGMNILHLDGRAHFVKAGKLIEKYDEKWAAFPDEDFLIWRMLALDDM